MSLESADALSPHDRVFLVGPMGAGKTTIGKALASKLGLQFVDSDHEIERRCGVKIPIIFELEGEAGFREREVTVIDQLSARAGVLLSTGGGAVLREESRARLHERGTVVYLHAKPDVLWHRTRGDRNRPLLATDDPRARIESMYVQRDPLYREVAHFVIETGQSSPRELAGRIAEILRPAA